MISHVPSTTRRQLVVELLLMVLLIGLPILLWIGHGDVENDEAIYSFAAIKMVETGEWLTPIGIYKDNPPFLEKPPLKFWLTALGLEMGLPQTMWGLRFADAALAILIFGYLVAIGLRLGGRWGGVLTALVFFAFRDPLLNHGVLANNTESAVLLQYTGSIFHFMAWADSSRRSLLHPVAIGLLFVLGFMSKFVAALFLPVTLVVVLLLHPHLLKRFFSEIWIWLGVAAMAAVLIAPWFIYQHWQFGQHFWNVIFGDHVVERFTAYLDPDHLKPWTFYVLTTVKIVIKSGGALAYLVGLFFVVREYPSARDPRITTLFAWYLVPVAAISLMSSKITHYMYPFLPAVAVVCGFGMARLLQWRLPAIGELPLVGGFGRKVPGLGAMPLQHLVFAVALLPVLVMYVWTLKDVRYRYGPFTALEACLDGAGIDTPLPAFFDNYPMANHIFTFTGLVQIPDADPEQLEGALYGDTPRPLWMKESLYRELVTADERALEIEAQRIPQAAVETEKWQADGVILLLPGQSAACSPKLSEAGAWRITPTEHIIRN